MLSIRYIVVNGNNIIQNHRNFFEEINAYIQNLYSKQISTVNTRV